MPMYGLPIEEIDESVKRPVVAGVIAEVLTMFGLSESLPMIFKGQAPQPAYLNSELNSRFLDTNNRFSGDSYLTIEDYDEEENEKALLSTPVNYIDNRGIFLDEDLRIFLVPSYVSKRFTVRISLTGTEKQIERWRSNIKRLTAQGVLNGIHSVKYHFPIPTACMSFLVAAHEMREKVAGLNEPLGAWFKRCFIPTMDVIRAADGSSPVFVIRQTQQPIQGWFDFGSGAPKKEKVDEMSRYSLNFTYTYYMDVPETITLITPLVIHNQLLPYQWIPKAPKMAALDFIKQQGTYSQEAFNHFRYAASANEYTYTTRPGIPIPAFDDWIADAPNDGYSSIMRILVRIDESNKHRVMNLQGLGEWAISPLCARYMKDVKDKLNKPYDSVINLMLYEGDQMMAMSKLRVDDELFVSYDDELDITKCYHLVVVILNDPSKLSALGLLDLLSHGCFFREWIGALFPWFAQMYGWNNSTCVIGSEDDNMTNIDIGHFIDELINGKGPNNRDPLTPIWPLVGMFTVYTHSLK